MNDIYLLGKQHGNINFKIIEYWLRVVWFIYNYKLQNKWIAVWKWSKGHLHSKIPSARNTSPTIMERLKTLSFWIIAMQRKINSSFLLRTQSYLTILAPHSKIKRCKASSMLYLDPKESPHLRKVRTKDSWHGHNKQIILLSSFWLICIQIRRRILPLLKSKAISIYHWPSTEHRWLILNF